MNEYSCLNCKRFYEYNDWSFDGEIEYECCRDDENGNFYFVPLACIVPACELFILGR